MQIPMMTTLRSWTQSPLTWLAWRPQRNVRLAISALVLLGSGYMAYLVAHTGKTQQILKDPVFLLLVGGIAALALLIWPDLGLFSLVPALILVKTSLGTGSATRITLPILMLALLMGLWIFDMIARQKSIRLFPSSTLAPVFAFLLSGIVALGVGQLPWFIVAKAAPLRAQMGELGIYVLCFGAFLWVGHRLRDPGMLEKITRLFFLASAIAVIGDLAEPLRPVTRFFVNDSAKGSLFWTWLVGMALGQVLLNKKLSRGWRLGLSGLLAVVFYVGFIVNRSWSSGWLPPLIAVVVILWFGFPRFRVPLVLFGLILALFFSQKIISVVMAGDNQYSLSTRLSAWTIISQLVRADPLFGLGLANYYWYTPLIPINGYRVVFNSHNNFVDILAQTGIFGTISFVWFAWVISRLAWRLRNRTHGDFSQGFIYGALGAWAGTLVAGMLGDWVLPFVYNIGFAGLPASLIGWFFLGGLLFYERIERQRPDRAVNARTG